MRLPIKTILEAIHYNPSTGVFTWEKVRPASHFKTEHSSKVWHANFAGKRAGHHNKCHGYVEITICRVYFRAHVLAWIYMTGHEPTNLIDHINQVKHDNSWDNLRLANKSINMYNSKRRSDNTSGVTGVQYQKKLGNWIAVIGKRTIGTYGNIFDACCARKSIELIRERRRRGINR